MSKVVIKPSITSENSIDVTIQKESHTAAVPIVEEMLKDPNCVFAAYKISHPNDDFLTMKIQGNDKKEAKKILEDGIKSVIAEIEDVIEQVKQIKE